MNDRQVLKILSHPGYRELRRRRNALGITLTLLMLLVYYGYIALIAFDKALLSRPLGAGVTTLGVPLGLAVILFTIIVTAVYVRRANQEFDALNEAILKDVSK